MVVWTFEFFLRVRAFFMRCHRIINAARVHWDQPSQFFTKIGYGSCAATRHQKTFTKQKYIIICHFFRSPFIGLRAKQCPLRTKVDRRQYKKGKKEEWKRRRARTTCVNYSFCRLPSLECEDWRINIYRSNANTSRISEERDLAWKRNKMWWIGSFSGHRGRKRRLWSDDGTSNTFHDNSSAPRLRAWILQLCRLNLIHK